MVAFFALTFVAIDFFTTWLQPVHHLLDHAIRPFYWITNVPARIQEWGDDNLVSRATLEEENATLKKQNLINSAQLQRMAELAAENLRLRQLLNATELLLDSVLVTEVIGVSPTPQSHTITIDRGRADNVYVGQPLLDAEGLMGQVIEVHGDHSIALLITDYRHALPVQVLRNGLRSIAEGTGDYNQLRLQFVSPTSDIKLGDELVSSGLGGRFPPGYPVGQVYAIDHAPGEAFLEVTVKPSAKLDRSRHLLLVFRSETTEIQDSPEQ